MADKEGEVKDIGEMDLTGIPCIHIKRRTKRKKDQIEIDSEKSDENEVVTMSEYRQMMDENRKMAENYRKALEKINVLEQRLGWGLPQGQEEESEIEDDMDVNADNSIGDKPNPDVPLNREEGWQKVTRTNRFALLATDEREEFPTLADQQKNRKEGPEGRNQTAQRSQTRIGQNKSKYNNNNNVKKGKSSPPLIKVYNCDVRELTAKVHSVLKHKLFSLKIVNKNIVNVKLDTSQDHQMVKKYFEEEKISFYTYTPAELKPYTVMIKGLSSVYEVAEVESFFANLKMGIKVQKIVKLNGDRWLVQVSHDSDIKAMFSIRFIIQCGVTVEKFKQGGLVQCRNCQRYGHISSNCAMPFRCVKCGLPHGPGKCEIPAKEENTEEYMMKDPITGGTKRRIGLPVRCVNCDTEGHVASAKTCPKRMEIKRRLDERKANKNPVPIKAPNRNPTAFRTPGMSYAGVVGGNTSGFDTRGSGPRGPNMMMRSNEAFAMIDEDCERYLGKDFFTCLEKVGNFAVEYAQLRTREEKTKALFGLLISIRLGD